MKVRKYPTGTFGTFGVCYKCGDTNGPWLWDNEDKIWLCEDCTRKECKNNGRKSDTNTGTDRNIDCR